MKTCEECQGVCWVRVRDRDHPEHYTVRPCERCLPEGYEKWKRGGFRSRWVTTAERGQGQVEAVTMTKALAEARAHLKSL